MEWSGQGEHGDTGWLQVSATDGGSAVTVHIHSSPGDNDTEINHAFDETMNGIKRLVEAAR
jgi:hypothetical protein